MSTKRRVVLYGRESCNSTNIQRDRLVNIGVEYEYVDVDQQKSEEFFATPTIEVYNGVELVRRIVGVSGKTEDEGE